jgi:hypothetical protein
MFSEQSTVLCCAVLCCAVLCCAVLCCAKIQQFPLRRKGLSRILSRSYAQALSLALIVECKGKNNF